MPESDPLCLAANRADDARALSDRWSVCSVRRSAPPDVVSRLAIEIRLADVATPTAVAEHVMG